jgi:uncharacterized protein (TIGR03663 family)
MSRSRGERSTRRRVFAALVVVTALALLVRLWALGWRIAHQDEARVAHRTLHYMRLGAWEYRPVIHGPFLPHVNGVVFSWLGPSDFTMRLVVAVAGGLLSLTPWFLRDRLSNAEMVGLAFFFAANPVLVYYSRFMRNDLIIAAAMFTAVALFVRALDTRRTGYLVAATFPFALGFTMKENALLYVVCWLGSLVLLLDGRLVLAKAREDATRLGVARTYASETAHALWRYKQSVVASLALFFVVVVAFYAPKPALYEALGNPAHLPDVVRAATLGSWEKMTDLWTNAHHHSYLRYLKHDLNVLYVGATALTVFAVFGFLYERYATAEPRPIVAFCFYWGAFSVFGYPAVMDITAGWTVVNAVVPLALPAAVGLGFIYERGRVAVASDNKTGARLAAAVLLVTAAGTGAVAYQTSFENPQGPDNALVQYAQPAGHMQSTLEEIRAVSETNDGVDVMFYGSEFFSPNDLRVDKTLPVDAPGYQGWHARLPLPWYFDIYGANVSSTEQTERLLEYDPPVVISLAIEEDNMQVDLEERGYRRVVHQGYQSHRPVVFYIRANATAG